MVRPEKWIPYIALGLALVWQSSPLVAQQPHLARKPQPAARSVYGEHSADRSTPADDGGGNYSDTGPDQSDSDADSQEIQQGTERDSQIGNSDESSEAATSSSPSSEPKTEIIKERYPDSSIKVEREVTQDAQGNYINHGTWKMWDQQGNPVAQGEYRYGNRTGTWIRWYRSPSEVPLLTTVPYRQFPAPFISQATFEHGQLDGGWIIYDGKKRKVSEFEFADGRRHGTSTWWYANGKKMREVQYTDGDINGDLIEWNQEGKPVIKDHYQQGRKLAQKSATYQGGAKKSLGMYLFARDVEKTPDDWWNCKLLVTTRAGKDEKHGPWTSWHNNGQHQLEGNYDHDVQIGMFTWWHSNGQKALEGRFDAGKQDGEWTWWYPTGQKSIRGEYAHGNPTGRWTWWKEDGRVAQSADLSASEGVVIDTPSPVEPAPMPAVRKPAPQTARKPAPQTARKPVPQKAGRQ